MNPKQFLAFSVVGLIGFFRVANGSGSGGEVPPLLPDDTDHNESPKNGSGQERNLPLKTVAHAEQSHLSTDSAMDSAHSKSSNPEKGYEKTISNGPPKDVDWIYLTPF